MVKRKSRRIGGARKPRANNVVGGVKKAVDGKALVEETAAIINRVPATAADKVRARDYAEAKARAEVQQRLDEAYGSSYPAFGRNGNAEDARKLGVDYDPLKDEYIDPDTGLHYDPLTLEYVDEEDIDDTEWDDDIPFVATEINPKHTVTVIQDHYLSYPKLFLDVWVDDEKEEPRFAEMFARSACKKAPSVLEADLVVFCGSVADVDPAFYGETAHPKTILDPGLDRRRMDLYLMCQEEGIPMLGICGGAQALHVFQGGKLWQDVDNHCGDHSMVDVNTKEIVGKVSSIHHQMVKANPLGKMQILATTSRSKSRAGEGKPGSPVDIGCNADIEAFFYPDNCILGIQGHPEYKNYNQFTIWTLNQIYQKIVLNEEVEWTKDTFNRRLRKIVTEPRPTLTVKKEGK